MSADTKTIRGTEFTEAMKKTHKIWLPDMLHYHNELLRAAFLACGYQPDSSKTLRESRIMLGLGK